MPHNKNRHPTEKKCLKPTPTDPKVSCGKKEREILRFLLESKNKRFNIKEYSRINKIPRSSVYEILKRLERKELVNRKLGENNISKKGEIYLECSNGGVGSSRRGCREINKLSTHYHKFKLPINDKKNFRIEKLSKINHKGIKENKLHNLHQTIVEFEDAKIVINPKQVIISLFEFIGDNVEDSDIKSLSRAVNYAEMLKKVGIVTDGVMVEEGHWARVESVLSDFLYDKVDNRYFLKLDDGSKFWIDHSNGKQEDETDNKLVRERVDKLLNQVASNDFDLTDIDKIKESLGFITKLESSRLQDNIEENKLEGKKLGLQKPKITEFKFTSYIG